MPSPENALLLFFFHGLLPVYNFKAARRRQASGQASGNLTDFLLIYFRVPFCETRTFFTKKGKRKKKNTATSVKEKAETNYMWKHLDDSCDRPRKANENRIVLINL